MKKLALLLAALGVVSAATYAAPELTVTNFGQSIETENTSNGNDINDIWLWNTVGLKYNETSIALTAGKKWTANYDHKDNFRSNDHRLQFDISRKLTDDFTLKGRYRGQSKFDRFQVGYDYHYGMLLSSGDFFYQSANGVGEDFFQAEWFPIGVKLGMVDIKYYLEYKKEAGTVAVGDMEESIEHQIRAYATLYKGERLTLSTEGRFTIHNEKEFNGKPRTTVDTDKYKDGYRVYDDFGRTRLYLKANYAMTENLDIYGTFGYEFRDWELKDNNNGKGYNDDHTEKYWSNVVIGYNYKF